MRKAEAAICVGLIVLFIGCENVGNLFGAKENPDTQRAPKGGIHSIVISESVPMYASASQTATLVATLSLGETVYWTQDSSVKEENDTSVFLKTVLSDGTSGWVRSQALIRDAQAAAVKEETRVYRRPDTLTLTEVRIPFMGMVAITDRTDQWVRVIGEGRNAQGWIRKDVITEEKEEVASAVFARRKIIKNRDMSRTAVLENILYNAPYADSYFIGQLRHMRSLESLFSPRQTEQSTMMQEQNRSDSLYMEEQNDTADSLF